MLGRKIPTTKMTADGHFLLWQKMPYVPPRRGRPPSRLRHCCWNFFAEEPPNASTKKPQQQWQDKSGVAPVGVTCRIFSKKKSVEAIIVVAVFK